MLESETHGEEAIKSSGCNPITHENLAVSRVPDTIIRKKMQWKVVEYKYILASGFSDLFLQNFMILNQFRANKLLHHPNVLLRRATLEMDSVFLSRLTQGTETMLQYTLC